jgi:uncharacterized membrane protein
MASSLQPIDGFVSTGSDAIVYSLKSSTRMEDTTMEQETHIIQHIPRNVNRVHAAEIAAAGYNTQIAVWLTEHVGSMWTAYIFAMIAIIGLFGILGLISPVVALLVAWISQTFIQLVLLPIIMVGQNVLGRKSELQADEAFATTMKTYADIEVVMKHLDSQDKKIYALEQLIQAQTDSILTIVQDLAKDRTQRG